MFVDVLAAFRSVIFFTRGSRPSGNDFNQSSIYDLAKEAAGVGAKLFVLDDGWFGKEYTCS
jgi:hypothetical protein